jgi:hypothetical protein
MSTNQNTYVVLGTKLPYDLFKDKFDQLEPYMDDAFEGIHHHDRLCVLYDGMNGGYVIIGKILAKTKNHQGFEQPIILNDTSTMRLIQGDITYLLFNKLKLDTTFEVNLIVVTHYR